MMWLKLFKLQQLQQFFQVSDFFLIFTVSDPPNILTNKHYFLTTPNRIGGNPELSQESTKADR